MLPVHIQSAIGHVGMLESGRLSHLVQSQRNGIVVMGSDEVQVQPSAPA